MDAIFRKEGQSLDYTPVSAVSAGDVIALQNNFYGIAKLDIAANELGALAITGIFQMAKPAGVINFGAILYWNAATHQAQTTPIDNAYFGRAAAAAADTDETVLVAVNTSNIGTVSAPEAQATPAVTQNAIAALTATDPTCDAADPSITAVDPAEMTAADPAAITATSEDADTTELIADVTAVRAEVIKLIDDVTAIRTQLVAAIADLATLRDSDKAIIDDVQAIETSLEAGIDDLATLKTAVNAAKTDLATAVTALTTAGLFE